MKIQLRLETFAIDKNGSLISSSNVIPSGEFIKTDQHSIRSINDCVEITCQSISVTSYSGIKELIESCYSGIEAFKRHAGVGLVAISNAPFYFGTIEVFKGQKRIKLMTRFRPAGLHLGIAPVVNSRKFVAELDKKLDGFLDKTGFRSRYTGKPGQFVEKRIGLIPGIEYSSLPNSIVSFKDKFKSVLELTRIEMVKELNKIVIE